MEYLKFNCYDLAAQNSEMYSTYSKVRQLSDELMNIINSLEPQMKSHLDLQKQLAASQTAVSGFAEWFLSAYNTLDKITDMYYAAESKALSASESLPTGAGVSVKTNANALRALPKTEKSSISNSDLILEGWLAELAYKDNSKARKT